MIEESPEKSARNFVKVRRYTSADIPRIAALTERLGSLALKRTLEHNTKNDFVCCLVVVDKGIIVGVLVARLISDPLSDDIKTSKRLLIQKSKFYAFEEAFYLKEDYRDQEVLDILFEEYRSWAARRNASRVTITNKLMPGFKLNLPEISTTYEV